MAYLLFSQDMHHARVLFDFLCWDSKGLHVWVHCGEQDLLTAVRTSDSEAFTVPKNNVSLKPADSVRLLIRTGFQMHAHCGTADMLAFFSTFIRHVHV